MVCALAHRELGVSRDEVGDACAVALTRADPAFALKGLTSPAASHRVAALGQHKIACVTPNRSMRAHALGVIG